MTITNFVLSHWSDIILALLAFFALTFQWIPPSMAGLDKQYYDLQANRMVEQRKQSLLEALMTTIVFTLNRSLLVVMTFRAATTILAFTAVGVELVFRHTLSTNAVVVAIIGIVALHFERLIELADELSIGKIFTYRAKK